MSRFRATNDQFIVALSIVPLSFSTARFLFHYEIDQLFVDTLAVSGALENESFSLFHFHCSVFCG
jgi:hypothetical protein